MADFGLVAGAVSRALGETVEGAGKGALQAVDVRRVMSEMARKRREAEMQESLFPGALQEQRLGIEEKQFGVEAQRQQQTDQEYAQAEYRRITKNGTVEPELMDLLRFYSDPRVKSAGYDTPKSLEVWRKFMGDKVTDPKDEAELLMKQRLTLTSEFDKLYKQFTLPGFYPELEQRDKALARLKQIRQTLKMMDQRLQVLGGVKPPPIPELPPDKSAGGNTWTDWAKRIISDAVGGAPEARGGKDFDYLTSAPSIEKTPTMPKAPKPPAVAKKPPKNPTIEAAIAEAQRLMARGHTEESALREMQEAGWDVE